MNRANTKHFVLALMATGVVALAAAVFLWGVEYKISLYPSPGAATRMPKAKLLSEEERPQATASLHPQIVRFNAPLLLTLLLLSAALIAGTRPGQTVMRLAQPSFFIPPCSSCFTHFWFRPPPAVNFLTTSVSCKAAPR